MFGSANYEHGRTTVADAAGLSARDTHNELEGLGFADHVIGPNDRVLLLLGGTDERHAIGGTSLLPGAEHTRDGYTVGTYQHTSGGFTLQASVHGGVASDEAAFVASSHERRSTFGTQIDASADAGSKHTIKLGLLGDRSTARELEVDGNRTRAARTSLALYAQDEWKITGAFTLNPGLRAEWLRGLDRGATFEPRASVVWQTDDGLSVHAGYSRFAAAPPLAEERPGTPLADEHDDYVDAGIQQRVGPVTMGADVYERWAHNYLTEHATAGTANPTAFAFGQARFRGVELSATYAKHGTNAWPTWPSRGLKEGRSSVALDFSRQLPWLRLAAVSSRWPAIDRSLSPRGSDRGWATSISRAICRFLAALSGQRTQPNRMHNATPCSPCSGSRRSIMRTSSGRAPTLGSMRPT